MTPYFHGHPIATALFGGMLQRLRAAGHRLDLAARTA
jgi:hypothetical protein